MSCNGVPRDITDLWPTYFIHSTNLCWAPTKCCSRPCSTHSRYCCCCVVPGPVPHIQGTSAFIKKGHCLWWWEVDRMQWASAIHPSSLLKSFIYSLDFPDGSVDKEPTCSAGNAGDAGSILGSGRSPGGGHGNPLQHTCLENLMDRGNWQTAVHGVTKSQTRLQRLSVNVLPRPQEGCPWQTHLSS